MTSTTREPDLDQFLNVFAEIERDPQSWDQSMWATQTACGTSYCFAGHACRLNGEVFVWEYDSRGVSDDVRLSYCVMAPDRPRLPVRIAAIQILGITRAQGHALFDANNTLTDLYRIAADILNLDPQVLRDKVQDRI